MNLSPPIIITRADLQRLERLLDSLDDYGPTAEALERELGRAEVVGLELDCREAVRALGQAGQAAVAAGGVGQGDQRAGVQGRRRIRGGGGARRDRRCRRFGRLGCGCDPRDG